MTIWVSIFTIILSLVIYYFNRDLKTTHKFLTGFLILFSLYAITHHLVYFGNNPSLAAIFWNHFSPFWVLAGPLIYFYVKFTIDDKIKWERKHLLHLVPSLVILIGVVPYYLIPFNEKVKILAQIQSDITKMTTFRMNIFVSNFTLLVSRPLIIFIYSCYSGFIVYKKYRFRNLNTSQYKLIFKWLLIVIIISLFSMLNLGAIGVNLILTTANENSKNIIELHRIQAFLFALLPVIIILFPKILYGMPTRFETESTNENIRSNSTFIFKNRIAFDNLSNQIINYINDQSPFVDKGFTIKVISAYLKVPHNHVDYCFNEILKVDFEEFISKKRVEHAQKIVNDPSTRKLSMDKIAELSGFSTRSDFYQACKQHIGMIPVNEEWNEYRAILQNYFDRENSFLQTGFKLKNLSNDTGIPVYILSEFINNIYSMNFNEFLNDKRIEYLKKLLNSSFDHSKYSIDAIGTMIGFQSKSSFFTAVKKNTGLTPSVFISQTKNTHLS